MPLTVEKQLLCILSVNHKANAQKERMRASTWTTFSSWKKISCGNSLIFILKIHPVFGKHDHSSVLRRRFCFAKSPVTGKGFVWVSPTSFPALLSTALAQAVSFSTLIGCNLNDESVRKILKTQLRYEISNGLQLQSTKNQETVLQFTRKQLLDNEMFNLH